MCRISKLAPLVVIMPSLSKTPVCWMIAISSHWHCNTERHCKIHIFTPMSAMGIEFLKCGTMPIKMHDVMIPHSNGLHARLQPQQLLQNLGTKINLLNYWETGGAQGSHLHWTARLSSVMANPKNPIADHHGKVIEKDDGRTQQHSQVWMRGCFFKKYIKWRYIREP